MAMGKACKRSAVGIVALIVVLGPGAGRAEAYIDPGTGSSILSSLGVLLGITCTVIAFGFTQIKYWGGWAIGKLTSHRKQVDPKDES